MTPVVGTFPISATADIESMPAVAGGACEFTVASGQAPANAPNSVNIRAARVLPDGSVPVTHRPVDVGNGPIQGGLQVASALALNSTHPSNPVQNEVNTALLVWWRTTGPVGPNTNDVRARFFKPVAPSVTPFSSACFGPGGSLPQIGTMNGPSIPGNFTFRVTIDNGPANSIAFLLISHNLTTTSIPGAPGCDLYVGFPLLNALPAVVVGNGSGSHFVPIPCSVPHGTTLAFQWIVYTPGWNPVEFVASDDLDIYWSHL